MQKKLHEEMDEIFGGTNRPATMADIAKMKYLECVMKECLRLYPSVPQIARLVEEDTEISRMLLTTTSIFISPISISIDI